MAAIVVKHNAGTGVLDACFIRDVDAKESAGCQKSSGLWFVVLGFN